MYMPAYALAVLACCSGNVQAQGSQQFNSVFMAMMGLPGAPCGFLINRVQCHD
jgi:hypothetical protein